MSIPPIHSPLITSGIAGTERAAAVESGRLPSAERLARQTEAVGKAVAAGRGDATGDHDADGRQSLDTFERRQRPAGQDPSGDPDNQPGAAAARRLPSDHLDLQA